jgi:aspartyl protease family protein
MLRNYLILVGVLVLFASAIRVPQAADLKDTTDEDGSTLVVEEPQAPPPAAHFHADGVVLRRQPDGHFYADAQINGATVHMLVDTGATAIALSRDDARKAGIGTSIGMPGIVGEGAGGAVKGEYVTLDRISLGEEAAVGMPAIVLDGGGRSLLGQAFLSKFASVEIRGDTMVLR